MEASLTTAAGLTTTTNGTYMPLQPVGGTEPIICEVFGKALGTSGAFSITWVLEAGTDGSTFGTTLATITTAGTAETKPIAIQQKCSLPFIRARVSSISGTGAALVLSIRVP